jgi:hypothetical protein
MRFAFVSSQPFTGFAMCMFRLLSIKNSLRPVSMVRRALRRGATSVNHEPHLALVGHRCDQQPNFAACCDLDYRPLAAIAAMPALVAANASLVTPATLCLFPFTPATILGYSRCSQSITASSSRSYARRAAFCGHVAPTRQTLRRQREPTTARQECTHQFADRSVQSANGSRN